MNTKAILVAVLAAVLIGTCAISAAADDRDVDAVQSTSATVNVTSAGDDMLIRFSESQYLSQNYAYSLAWSAFASATDSSGNAESQTYAATLGTRAASSGTTAGAFTSQDEVTVNSLVKLTLTEKTANTPNVYNLKVVPADNVTSPVHLIVKCTVTIDPANTENEEDVTTLDFYYFITVNIIDATSTMTITYPSSGTSYSFTQYTNESQVVSATVGSTAITVTDYSWYATGLPAGLSMRGDGTIVGYPIESTADVSGTAQEKVVSVTAINNTTGQVYNTTMKVKVEPLPTDLTVTVSADSGLKVIDGTYYVESGTEITVTVEVPVDGATVDNLTIYAIDSDNKVTAVTGDTSITSSSGDFTYTATVGGSGDLTFVAVYHETEHGYDLDGSVDVVVLGKVAGDTSVSADIVVTTTS